MKKRVPIIELYTQPTCSYCDMVKKELRLQNINFIEYKVDVDISEQRLKSKYPKAQFLPVIAADSKLVEDFKSLMALLELK